jgi:nitroreductase
VELSAAIKRRRMVRNYDADRPVAPELVDKLLGYAVHAPSAGFSQGWDFLHLGTPEERESFWAATTVSDAPTSWLDGMRRAPVIIVPLSHRDAYLERYAEPDKGWTDRDEARWPVPYWDIDTGMASLLILLGAVDEGLGACFFGIPPERTDDFRTAFGVPASRTPIGAIALGYPAPDKRSPSLKRGRRDVGAVVHRGRWSSQLG